MAMDSMEVRRQLDRLAVAFVLDEGGREDFVRCYSKQAQELANKATATGYNYELTLVPGGQTTLQGLLGVLRETSIAKGHTGISAWFHESLWVKELEEMHNKEDNFGITKEAQLSALLLNPDDEKGKREGLFFTDLNVRRQKIKATELMVEKPDVRCLTVAEYVCIDIVRVANKERVLDEETFTRFLQYGWIDTDSDRLVPRVCFLCGQMLYFDGSLGDAGWNTGVRFSVRESLLSIAKERLS